MDFFRAFLGVLNFMYAFVPADDKHPGGHIANVSLLYKYVAN
jgi:hypothetical protein